MLAQISIFIIALAFAVLVFFLVRTLRSASTSLEKVTDTLLEVQKTIDELSYEVKQMLRHANDITIDVEHKMKQIEPVVTTVKNLGDVLAEITAAGKQLSTTFMSKLNKAKPAQAAAKATVAAEPAQPSDSTFQAYDAVHSKSSRASNWLAYVDIAAGAWSKIRSR
ncbi:DUF948 domain-containing protein [Paenibacillus sp. P96]|uniref:DUF948 domain-containing protein n=1 Tax=Paenibacillus zeirhizosphaerae TaxID=2987519 RepID=A0ABT9FTM2_9BACL|nr:DUF948 domain-containing protein [Paenibacillus sp. P96]MDP4098068.1 DUF948 domain-containing protein [Paenibacillus sp. P96]